jgi:predicted cupin superfamily sugar epimerase
VDARARDLIQILELERHPEGGYYREVFRSTREVRVPAPAGIPGAPATDAPAISRSAITTIYFLLVEGEPSGWHSVASDEIWHHLEGAPGELTELSLETSSIVLHRLGPLGDGAVPVATIPAGHWQSARTLGAYTLVGCTVGPGFDFEDFKLLADDPEAGERVRRLIGDVKAS